MSNSALQEKVNRVMNALTRTGEFRDVIEIVKELLCLIYLSSKTEQSLLNYPDDNIKYHLKTIVRGAYDPFRVSVFYDDVLNVSDTAIRYLIDALRDFDISDEAKRIELADCVIKWAANKAGKLTAIFSINSNLGHLIAFIASEIGMDAVVDPFAGVVSYAVTPEFTDIEFSGSEYFIEASIISNLLLAIHGRKMSVENKSLADNWEYPSIAENLITFPPLNYPVKELHCNIPCGSKYVHELIVERFIEDWNSKKAIILLPAAFAYSGTNEWLRKELVQRNFLDKVISLPSGALNGTQIHSLILVLDKTRDEQEKDLISFISLSDCIYSSGKGRFDINLDQAKEVISKCQGKFAKNISYGEIIDSINVDINPGKYIVPNFIPEISGKAHIASLFAFLRPIETQPQKVKLGETKDIIGIKDLSDTYDFTLIGQPSSKTTSRYVELTEDAIILALSNGKFRLGRFKFNGTPIPMSSNLFAYKDDGIMDMDYLLLELSKPYISDQLSVLGLNNISGNVEYAVHNIHIVCEERHEQKRIVQAAQKQKVAELHVGLSSIQSDYRKDVHIKRHAMGQTIGTLGSWWTLLEQARANGKYIDENAILPGTDTNIGSILDNIKMCFGRLATQVDKFDRGYKATPTAIYLDQFIEEYLNTHQSPTFRYELTENRVDSVGDTSISNKVRVIYFPYDVLQMILNNIVSNACSHGFGNKPSSENIIKIEVEAEDGSFILSISNNGVPCPPDMTPQKMITYGESSDLRHHCGIGGYEISHLMNDFGGALEIKLDSFSEFPVEYRLTFKSIENE